MTAALTARRNLPFQTLTELFIKCSYSESAYHHLTPSLFIHPREAFTGSPTTPGRRFKQNDCKSWSTSGESRVGPEGTHRLLWDDNIVQLPSGLVGIEAPLNDVVSAAVIAAATQKE